MKTTQSTERGLLDQAKLEAEYNRLNISRSEAVFREIMTIYNFSISLKYQAMYYFASTGNYSAEELAEIFRHKRNNINADFNKNLGVHLKNYFELGDDERVGITSLRRLLFQKGFLLDINDIDSVNILEQRLDENVQVEQDHRKELLDQKESLKASFK